MHIVEFVMGIKLVYLITQSFLWPWCVWKIFVKHNLGKATDISEVRQ